MGWDSQKEPVDDLEFHLKRVVGENFGLPEIEVIDIACINSVAYLAVRVDDDPAYVTAVVVPFFNNAESGFGYKVVNEWEGPVRFECPDRIMKQLSPIKDLPEPGLARDWRRGVERERRTEERSNPETKPRDHEQSDRDR